MRAVWRRGRVMVMAMLAIPLLRFITAPSAEAQPVIEQAKPVVVARNLWLQRNSLTSGNAEGSFVYGTTTQIGVPLMGDWDGDGVKTPGVVYGNKWFLRNSNTSGVADVQFTYGFNSGVPVVGDWDGDGDDTPGMTSITCSIANSTSASFPMKCNPPEAGFTVWYLRNDNTGGVADETFAFGASGWPLAGDWDGDGDDTPGIRRFSPHSWALNNDFDSTAEIVLSYGTANDFPIVGDWDADGDDTIGVIQWNVWALRNSNTSGVADMSFAYGSGHHRFLVWG